MREPYAPAYASLRARAPLVFLNQRLLKPLFVVMEVATAPSMSPKSSQSKFCCFGCFFLMVRTCGLRRLPAAEVLRASCQARLSCNSTSHQKTHKHMWDNSSEHAYKAYQAITKKSLRRCLRNMFPQKVLTPACAVQALAYAGPCYDTTLAWHVTGVFRAAHMFFLLARGQFCGDFSQRNGLPKACDCATEVRMKDMANGRPVFPKPASFRSGRA